MTAVQFVVQDRLRLVVAAIAGATIASGLGQMLLPGFVLGVLSADRSPTPAHFFAIVGMFMAVLGALVLHAVLTGDRYPLVILWGAVQKFGAFLAVSIGVGRGIFAALAMAVAIWLATGPRSLSVAWGVGAPALMLVAVVLQLAIQYHAGALRAHGEFQRVSAALATQGVLGGGLGLALVVPYSAWGLLWGWIAGSLAALAWLRGGTCRPPLVPGRLREGLALAWLGLPVFAAFLVSLVLRSVDRMAFVRHVGTEGLGLYSIGLMAAGMILYLPEAAATVLYPRMSAAAQGARDPERTRDEVRRAQRALAVLLPPFVALGMVWAAPVTRWLLPAFVEGLPALRWLAVGALLAVLPLAALPVEPAALRNLAAKAPSPPRFTTTRSGPSPRRSSAAASGSRVPVAISTSSRLPTTTVARRAASRRAGRSSPTSAED